MDVLMDIAVGMLLIYVVIDFIRKYTKADGTRWARLWSSFKDSGTIMWSRFVAFATSFVSAIAWGADILNAPQVAAAIQQYLSPRVVAGLMIFTVVITEIARRRTGSTDPVQ